ncbi:GTP cyclohydrolase II [Streptomyces noursei]|uniref:GTP cyclohydrolase II n=1 Tax=Streptomyces noursei TaxID=1971 RepID=UPI001E5CEA3F|nr:GTP cyclohydrolase II [Streptomyces noursei]MCZ1014860.1 GTP cyclohydrolase II [Streptomyces noursei]
MLGGKRGRESSVGIPTIINDFSGEWAFLSNYYPVVVDFEGVFYPSVEHAYQAGKCTDVGIRSRIRSTLDPDRAKELGRTYLDRSDWDDIKVPVMRQLVAAKFSVPYLRERLLESGDALLVEGNTWGGTFWGMCEGVGENVMGRILMDLREELQKEQRRFEGRGSSSSVSVRSGTEVSRAADAQLRTQAGEVLAVGYVDAAGNEHVALVVGDVSGKEEVLVRVHSECFTGDVLDSLRCDCGEQLRMSMREINQAGVGVVLYLRGHEGRGIGLMAKLRAYRIQDALRLDTVDANVELGLPVDARDYSVAAAMLDDLGIRSIRLLTNNPAKETGLSALGVNIAGRVPLLVEPGVTNRQYLVSKRDRMGHELPDSWGPSHAMA